MNIDTGKDLKGFDFLKLMRQLKNKITHKGFDKVFSPILIHYGYKLILVMFHLKELYTFDDGSDNIFPHPNLLREPDTFKYKLIKAFIGDKYSVNKLFKK